MMEQLDELYREVILEHFSRSTHSGEIPDAQIRASGSNPLCGDEISFDLKLGKGDQVEKVLFHGKGCAISQAASSMLAAQLEGKTLEEATAIIESMKALMQGKDAAQNVDLGDLEALSGVRKFPVRVKCAALSWNVVEQGLEEYRKKLEVRSEK